MQTVSLYSIWADLRYVKLQWFEHNYVKGQIGRYLSVCQKYAEKSKRLSHDQTVIKSFLIDHYVQKNSLQ